MAVSIFPDYIHECTQKFGQVPAMQLRRVSINEIVNDLLQPSHRRAREVALLIKLGCHIDGHEQRKLL